VLAVYDNGGRTADRYTVVYTPERTVTRGYPTRDVFPYVHMSSDPFWPQGVCQHGELGFRPTAEWGREKVIAFEELPPDCQRAVRQDLAEEEATYD
jgi:hypothetical protein